MHPIKLASGSMIAPNVRLVRPLAHGGMATLWLAEHLGLEAEVAVKVVDPVKATKDPNLAKRFRREATFSARVRSVHVVQVFESGELPDGRPFIVMELLDGQSLEQWLNLKGGRLSINEMVTVVGQVAKALGRAHAAGIVHRDVKPENIFLQRGDYELFIKLLDFGIAKEIDAPTDRGVTRTGVGVGTPGYISPEQVVNAKRVDHRADLWSLGAVAYRCVTGKLPYDCSKRGWWTGLTHPCDPPSHFADGLPEGMDGWFARALHPVADKRFTGAVEMADALREIVGRREPPPPRGRHASDEGPTSSVRPGQFGLFDDVQTDEGTLIMDEGDHVRAEAPLEGEAESARPRRAKTTTKRRVPRPRKKLKSTTSVSRER